MKKIIPLIYVLIFVIMVIFSVNMSKTYANQGCCSWHGGISHCGSNGRYVCNDGTYSPSCTCYVEELTDGYDYIETAKICREYINTISEQKNTIYDLEAKIDKLEEENKNLKESNETNENWILILIFGIIGYAIYKTIKSNYKND